MKKRKLKRVLKTHSRKRTHHHKGIFCSCRGGISPKYIAIGAVIVLGVAAGGYFMFNNSSSENGGIINKITNSGGKKITESDFAGIKDPLLRKNYVAQANAKKIRNKIPLADANGEMKGAVLVYEIEMLGDFLSGKYNSYTWREQNGTKKAEYMTIGDTTYVKDYSDSKWWKQTRKTEQVPTGSPQSPIQEKYKDVINQPTPEPSNEPQKIGEEPCPNTPSLTCYKYSETSTFMNNTTKTIFWFDNKEYLKRKEMQEDGTGWTIFEYDNINITPPSPTKDVPAGKDIYEFTTQSYLEDIYKSNNTNLDQSSPKQFIPQQSLPTTEQDSPQDVPQEIPTKEESFEQPLSE